MAQGQRRYHSRSSGINSTEIILDNTDINRELSSDWSVVWSTSHVPGMDTATGGGSRRRKAGRRRLRFGALATGALLAMHLRVSAAALCGGVWMYILMLMPAMALLGNPLRHFEVYLGQWSISGPGRAFRILPMFDGIGIAIAITSLVRAMVNCALAAMATIYLMHSLADESLPYTKCRDFNLKPYEPEQKPEPQLFFKSRESQLDNSSHWNLSGYEYTVMRAKSQLQVCENPYEENDYPPYCGTAAYNFFYVEVANFRPGSTLTGFNTGLAVLMAINWAVIWCCMIYEKVSHGRLIWNNTPPWLICVPVAWVFAVFITGVLGVLAKYPDILQAKFYLESGSIAETFGDALETAIYVHAATMGSEIIHGKGLNHYASGHIDPALDAENVWHSALLMALTALSSGGAALCAVTDHTQTNIIVTKATGSSTWILPMYSKCATFGTYTHLKSMLIFSGLIFSYVAVSYVLVKSALHTIFEYRVKLVFIEQYIVGALVISCTLLSMIFATHGGLPLLESVDSMMAYFAMPLICLLEVLAVLVVYNGEDFVSDMNISMEDSDCGTRMEIQWASLPFILVILFGLRVSSMTWSCLPTQYLLWGLAPLVAVLLAVPLRACHNAYVFLRPAPRHGI